MNRFCQTIIFSDKAYNAIIDETFRKDPIETGGILLGHIFDNGIWVVMEVIPPGIDSVHQYAYFEYDERFVNYLAESVASKYENKLELLGLWHRHPGSMDTFSGTDDGTNRVFAGLRACGAISGLVNVDPKFRLTMRHVSNPLQYEIVDFEVGDDLIPDEYFQLKHFPNKGLNPEPNFEKKNLSKSTEPTLEQKSKPKIDETPLPHSRKEHHLYKWSIGILCALFFLMGFFALSSAQRTIGKESSKMETLFEVAYRPKVDTVQRKSEVIRCDSLAKKTEVQKPTKRSCETPEVAVLILKYALLLLAFFSLLFAWIAPYSKRQRFVALGALLGALFLMLLSPIRFSVAFFVFAALLTALLFLLSWGVMKGVELFKNYQVRPWYQKNRALFFDEDDAVRKEEPLAERSFEDNQLVYTVVTERHITRQEHTLAYQMVYQKDYLTSHLIRIYFIMPDLEEMFNADLGLNTSFIRTDELGDKYLIFSNEQMKLNGGELIKKFYEWIDLYNRCRAGEQGVQCEKL